MKIALAQMDIAWLKPEVNLEKIARFVEESERTQASILLFPEMALSGFSMDPSHGAVDWDGSEMARLAALTKATNAVVVCGAAIRETNRFTNRALVFYRGKLVCNYSKINLFSFAGEDQTYASGSEIVLFETEGLIFCPLICYDLRFSEVFLRAVKDVTGAFLVIANWPENRADHWKSLLKARALDSQATVVGVNRVGRGETLNYVGESGAFSGRGKSLLGWSGKEELLTVEIDPASDARFRKAFPLLTDRDRLCSAATTKSLVKIS